MYHVLVVDDDPNIRMGLSQMIANKYINLLKVTSCENGLEALKEIHKGTIDMMVTDIKMPVMNGIELLHQLHEADITISSIVLSGFDDYNLVRDSLKAGAVDYLLKPVNMGLLYNTLDNIIKSLEVNRSNADKKISTTLGEDHMKRQLILEHFLLDLNGQDDMAIHYKNKHEITQGTLGLLCYTDMNSSLYSKKLSLRGYLEEKTQNFVHLNKLNNNDTQVLFGEINDYWIVLTLFTNKKAVHNKQLVSFYTPLLQSFRNENLKVVSQEKALPISHLSFAKAECLRGFERYYFDLPYTNNQDQNLKELEREWLCQGVNYMADYNFAKTIEILSRLFALYNSVRPSITHIKRTLSDYVYDIIEKNPKYIPIVSSSKFTKYDMLDCITNSTCLSKLQACMFDITNYYIKRLVESMENKDDFIIKKAKSYIHNNYADSLTLSDVASHVFLHSSYFSTVFKTKTGTTFRQYLRDYRIQKSKELMLEGRLKIYEIAQAVGYQESANFVRAFKEVEGENPSEFKHRM